MVFFILLFLSSVADPDLQAPYVFWPAGSGSGSISTRYRKDSAPGPAPDPDPAPEPSKIQQK